MRAKRADGVVLKKSCWRLGTVPALRATAYSRGGVVGAKFLKPVDSKTGGHRPPLQQMRKHEP